MIRKPDLKAEGVAREEYYAKLSEDIAARSSERPWEDLYGQLMDFEQASNNGEGRPLTPKAERVLRYLQTRRWRDWE